MIRNQEIRLFVSSTFKDMDLERDELVKKVFPLFREWSHSRSLSFTEIDLRWGITEEQANQGNVIPICLDEIDNCRPFFICLLGDRYGTSVNDLSHNILAQHPWLAQQIGKSITELEIIYGALSKYGKNTNAHFYLRTPDFYETPSLDMPRDNFFEISDLGKSNLKALKTSILESKFPVHYYSSVQQLGESILQDLKNAVEQEVLHSKNPISKIDWHHNYASRKSQFFFGRKKALQKVSRFLNSKRKKGLIITGREGIGKTALIAKLWQEHFQDLGIGSNHKDSGYFERFFGPSNLLPKEGLIHFVEANAESSTWRGLIKRIIKSGNKKLNLNFPIPETPNEFRTALRKWFVEISLSKKSLVIMLDGIENLEDEDQALDFNWLPIEIPKGIKVIITCSEGYVLEKLSPRKWEIFSLDSISPADKMLIVTEHLGNYGKSLNSKQISAITENQKTDTPLFLRTLLEELRIFGHFDKLNEYIAYYSSSKDSEDLLLKIFERIENDFELEHPGLVGSIMQLIWGSRHGLAETELLDIIGKNGTPLPTIYWSPIYLALKEVFVKTNGLLNFSHHSFKKAVEVRYLDTSDKQISAHEKLRFYFENQKWTVRKIDELPWQLTALNDLTGLAQLLTNETFFRRAIETRKYEIKAYWGYIQRNSNISMIEEYRTFLTNPKKYLEIIWEVCLFIKESGFLSELEHVLPILAQNALANRDSQKLQVLAGFRGQLAFSNKFYAKALQHFIKQEELGKEAGMDSAQASSLNNQANIYRIKENFGTALELYKKAMELYKVSGDNQGICISLANMGTVSMDTGKLDEALILFKKQCRLSEEISDYSGLCSGWIAQASINTEKKSYKEALKLLKRAEELSKQIGDFDILFKSQTTYAYLYQQLADYDQALEIFEEQNTLSKELNNNRMLALNLASQAKMYALKLNQPAYALPIIRQGYQLFAEGNFSDMEEDIPKLLGVIETLAKN